MKKIVLFVSFLALILNAESIKIAVDSNYPPFEYKNADNQLVGFDIELIEAISKKAGFDYTLVEAPHDTACEELNKKNADIAISAFTHDETTSECDSSESYYNSRFIFLKIAGSQISSTDDLIDKKVGYIGSNTVKEMIEAFGAKPVRRDRNAIVKLFIAMQEGKADALIIDSRSLPILTNNYEHMNQADKESLDTYEKMDFGKSLEIFYQEEVGSQETIILFPNDGSQNDLKERINKAISELKSDGSIENLINKYHL